MAQGGPGGSTIDTYSQLIPLDPRLNNLDRDIVLFDQRGTLYSKPSLVCPEYLDMSIATLNEDLTREQSDQKIQESLKSCHDRLVKEGVNLSAFDSIENARDVESLRQALGYEKINLYGVSYGTLLALHVMREFPEGLRSVIINSVVPPQTNFMIEASTSNNRALEAVFSGCASEPACNKAYPNLRQVFYDTVEHLNANKVNVQLTDFKNGKDYTALIDGNAFLSAVVQMLYMTDLIPLIPRVIYQARSGDFAFLNRILSLVVFDRTMSIGMYYSVTCSENSDFNSQEVKYSDLPKPLAESEKDNVEQFIETCSFWKVDPLEASVGQPVKSDVPTLVLTGSFDPITPPAYAKQAASTLSSSHLFEFPVGGHGELTSGECQDQIVLQFLDNPAQKPDGACVAKQKMAFSTPADLVRFPAVVGLLNLQGAAGVQVALYVLALLFLLTALLVYPVVWLVRLFRRPSADPVAQASDAYPVSGTVIEGGEMLAEGASPPRAAGAAPRPLLYRLGPWLAALAAISLLVFIAVVYVVAVQMALRNDNRFLMGLPGNIGPLFLLPWAALAAALAMLGGAASAWARRVGSGWGRAYFSLLTAAAWVCVIILGMWGALTALFAR